MGDVVIVSEDGVHRGLWKLGRVEKLITGKDGIICGAVVKSTTPKGKTTRLRRLVKRLYLLELSVYQQEDSTQRVRTLTCLMGHLT